MESKKSLKSGNASAAVDRTAKVFATVEEAIQQFQAGGMVIVVDDEDRENEGDLTIAADKVTPDAINFMARYGRGLVCLSMTGPVSYTHLTLPTLCSV